MKQILFTLSVLLGFIHTIAAQSPFLTLIEESTTGKYFDTIPSQGLAIADINSRIRIMLNIPALENEMFRFQGVSSQDSRLLRLRRLNTLLRHQNAILGMLNTTFQEPDKTKVAMKDYKAFAGLLNDLLMEIQSDPELGPLLNSNAMMSKFLSEPDKPLAIFLIDYLNEEAQNTRDSLLTDIGANGQIDSSLLVYFRLGAFVKDKRGGHAIHIENFDDYQAETPIEVSRFGVPLSDSVKMELEQNRLLNDSIQVNSSSLLGHFGDLVRTEFSDFFPSNAPRLRLKDSYENAMAVLFPEADAKPAIDILKKNFVDLEKVDNLYRFTKDAFETLQRGFPTSLLQGNALGDELDNFVSFTQKAFNNYAADVTSYAQSVPSTFSSDDSNSGIAGLSQLQLVQDNYQGYVDSLNTDIQNVKNIISRIKNIVQPFKKSYLKNEEFSDKVRRFSAGNLPEEGIIEIQGIHKRSAGDEILLKATLERGSSRSNPNYESREIYRQYVRLARVSPYLRMSGSLVLANAYARDGNTSVSPDLNNFQFAPTYGIFMKWGSRKSRFYNDFVNLGTGLGFSSPDFSLDGTPEFGAAVMITGFRDILSVGWGWNFGANTPYTFVGFNLPFSVGGFSSVSNTNNFVPN